MTEIARVAFEQHRRAMWALCYRMTGSAADADDLVQDVFVRALERSPDDRGDGWRPWLMKVAAHLAIDVLRRRRRREYVGPWLPAPIDTEDVLPSFGIDQSAETRYSLMESVSMAFLLALERLTPRQRAVLLLRDVFDYSGREVAEALDMTEGNVKVTLHRARAALASYNAHRASSAAAADDRALARLQEFLGHLAQHDVEAVERMLADDVRFLSDGGGEFAAALQPVIGRAEVSRLLFGVTAKRPDVRGEVRILNGGPAFVAESSAPAGWASRFVLRIELRDDGLVSEVHTILATRKLAGVRPVSMPQ